jgi:hypothetical protein
MFDVDGRREFIFVNLEVRHVAPLHHVDNGVSLEVATRYMHA